MSGESVFLLDYRSLSSLILSQITSNFASLIRNLHEKIIKDVTLKVINKSSLT